MSLYRNKYPQQLFRKQLWVTKVNHTSPRQKELNKAIHSLFYNPSTFFETSYDGKEVVVGRKNPTVHSFHCLPSHEACEGCSVFSKDVYLYKC